MSDPYLGEIRIFAGNYAPQGWFPCDGRLLPISQYSALFSLLGTMYGGDGVTTFALPDLRGRVVMSFGQAPGRSTYSQGETGGAENVTILSTQMPTHTHAATATVKVNASAANRGAVNTPAGAVPGPINSAYLPAPDGTTTMNANMVNVTVANAPAGGSQPLPTLPPFLVINYIIAYNGIYPPRP